MNILILHGPNLNLLGEREPEVYGTTTLAEVNQLLEQEASKLNAEIKIFQSNHEGVLIDLIHEHRKWMHGLVFNPGAYTHYAYALRDAVASVNQPMIEVHLSDITKRESFRAVSVFDGLASVRRIMGKGVEGYLEALRLFVEQ